MILRQVAHQAVEMIQDDPDEVGFLSCGEFYTEYIQIHFSKYMLFSSGTANWIHNRAAIFVGIQ